MADIVLVPGAYHGGWYFSPILPQLRATGHTVHAMTLTGLAGNDGGRAAAVNLDTHIADVVNLVEAQRLADVVLCGHSYGGMVIAGASERLGDAVRALLFIDALVPEDGESVWSIWPKETRHVFIDASPDGLTTAPPPDVDPRARAHPLATFLQPIALGTSAYAPARKTYALCAANAGSLFFGVRDRLSSQPGWTIENLDCGHDIMRDAPELAATTILKAAAR